jgi:DNA-binding winged helix-turn-helix (wHTH) protein
LRQPLQEKRPSLAQTSNAALAFGPYRFLPRERIVLRHGKPLRLGCRAREILAALLERAGEVVNKRELIKCVWPESVVGEGTLRVHIAALRKALGESQAGVRYVENITGRGYRFVAPVKYAEQTQPKRFMPGETAEAAHSIPSRMTRSQGRAHVVSGLATRLPPGRSTACRGPGGVGNARFVIAEIDQLHAAIKATAVQMGRPLLAIVHVDATSWAVISQLLQLIELPEMEHIHTAKVQRF